MSIPQIFCKDTAFYELCKAKRLYINFSSTNMLYINNLGMINIKFPIIKIWADTTGLPATYDSHTRHLRDDSTPKIASFRPSKVSDY